MPFTEVEKVAYIAGQRFIRDMGKMGFDLYGGRLHLDPTPRMHVPVTELPSRANIEKMGRGVVGGLVHDVAPGALTDYRMWGLFIHAEIPVEVRNGSRG